MTFSHFAFAQDQRPTALRDAVVAVVDKDVITRSQLLEEARPQLEPLLRMRPDQMSPDERQRRSAEIMAGTLREMVDEKLMVAEGEKLEKGNENFKRSVAEKLKEQIDEEKSKAGGDAEWRKQLEAKKTTPAKHETELHRQILRDVIIYQFITRDLTVSPEEIKKAYQEHVSDFRDPPQVSYRQIFFRIPSAAARDEVFKIVKYDMELLAKQSDFADLAKKSDDPHASDGGFYDFQQRGARPPAIDDVLFSLKPGEIGGPIETDKGFYILRVEQRREGRQVPFEEAQSKIERELIVQRRAQRYQELIDRLQKEHHVEVMD